MVERKFQELPDKQEPRSIKENIIIVLRTGVKIAALFSFFNARIIYHPDPGTIWRDSAAYFLQTHQTDNSDAGVDNGLNDSGNSSSSSGHGSGDGLFPFSTDPIWRKIDEIQNGEEEKELKI